MTLRKIAELLQAEVLTGEDNAPAQALYQKMGFSPSGEAHFEQGL